MGKAQISFVITLKSEIISYICSGLETNTIMSEAEFTIRSHFHLGSLYRSEDSDVYVKLNL